MSLTRLVRWINGPITAAKTTWEIISGISGLAVLWAMLGWTGSNFEPISKYGWGAITFASCILSVLLAFSIAALLASIRYFRGPPKVDDINANERPADPELVNERRELIASGRRFVSELTRSARSDERFRDAIESSSLFYRLRPHLSQKFLDSLKNRNNIIVPALGSKLTGIAARLLDEIDRLESEWFGR
jgi:hypothetical protein